MDDSGSGLKMLMRKKVSRNSYTNEVVVMTFEGVLGGWLDEPTQKSKLLLLRADYQDALQELS
jgi:hypothetical protein